jgi:hypothetical protein
MSKSYMKVIITFLAHCHYLARKNGIRYLVIYLKAHYVNLQQSLGGKHLEDLGLLGARFSRTNRG